MTRRFPSVAVGLLLLLGAALSAAVVLRLAEPVSDADGPRAAPERSAAARPASEAGSASVPEPDPAHGILERPLFNPSRRLHSAFGAPRGAARVVEPAGRLVGVVIGTEGREAMFADADNRVTIVRQGNTFHGWIVQTIEPDRVILISAQGQRTLNLATDRLRPAAPLPTGPSVVVPAGQTLWRPTPAPIPPDPATAGQPAAGRGGEGR